MTFVLDATNKTLKFSITAGAGADVHFTSHWADATTTGFTEGQTQGTSNDSTAVDAVASPAASTRRVVKLITFHNTNTTLSRTVTLVNDVGGTSRTIAVFTLAPLATWYSDTAATTAIADGDKGDITVSGSGATWTIDNNAITTAKILDANVTLAKIQNITSGILLGRTTGGSGPVQEITPGTGVLTWLQDPINNNLSAAVVTLAAGTAAAPALTTTGDPNTGLAFPSADNLIFATGGLERLRIDNNGNVSIGALSAPQRRFSIEGVLPSSGGVSVGFSIVGTSPTSTTATCLAIGSNLSTAAASTLTNLIHYRAAQGTLGAGTNLTNQVGFEVLSNVAGATNNLGFSSAVPASATNYSFFSGAGAANSRFAGQVLHEAGSATAPSMTIDGDLNTGIAQIGGADTLSITTAGVERLRVAANGETFIAGFADNGAYNLQVAGTGVWGAGAYVNGSDERIKTDIKPLNSGLDVVQLMRPVTFRYLPEFSTMQDVQPGFIAQELQSALAGTEYVGGVVSSGSKYLNVAYQSIIPILVKAVQELSDRLTALESLQSN